MAASRRVVECNAYARSAAFTGYENMVLLGDRVSGTTLGIVGMGTIGLEVAKRAAGFSMDIVYHNRNRSARVRSARCLRMVAVHCTYRTQNE